MPVGWDKPAHTPATRRGHSVGCRAGKEKHSLAQEKLLYCLFLPTFVAQRDYSFPSNTPQLGPVQAHLPPFRALPSAFFPCSGSTY